MERSPPHSTWIAPGGAQVQLASVFCEAAGASFTRVLGPSRDQPSRPAGLGCSRGNPAAADRITIKTWPLHERVPR
jgi:hypothetical protein